MKQHKRDAHRDISASVTPPRKKTKEIEPDIEPEIERVLTEMENLNVEDIRGVDKEMREEDKIPERLKGMLKIKGVCINDYMLRRVGGGGQCGVNCVSLHTTGKEDQATEIRTNINEHIVENWEEIYKYFYNFPYTERIGSGNITFNNEDEFIDFLLHEKTRASTLWMTHVYMQAASTMLNIKISILTTGIPPSRQFICVRCKPSQDFKTKDNLRNHTENVHMRFETKEEIEGRMQNTRWSLITPDPRLKEIIPNEREEELILLHEDDIHYNMIVHKSHNASKNKYEEEHKKKYHGEETTLFGDVMHQKSWAQITKAFRPNIPEKLVISEQVKNHTSPNNYKDENLDKNDYNQFSGSTANEEGWQKVQRKGIHKIQASPKKPIKEQAKPIEIPLQNKFSKLIDINTCEVEDKACPKNKCESCGFEFKSRNSLEQHRQSAHGQKIIDKDEIINRLKSQLTKEIRDHKETKRAYATLEKQYKDCEGELKNTQEEKERQNFFANDLHEIVELSNVTVPEPPEPELPDGDTDMCEDLSCKQCGYPFKDKHEMNLHIEKHKVHKLKPEVINTCHLCAQKYTSNNEFRNHIRLIHVQQFNCTDCDFQGSSQIILNKHINLRHKRSGDQEEDTFKCDDCSEQFSARWNLNNHVRDNHGVKENCVHFERGSCKFPANVCWKNHVSPQGITQTLPGQIVKCYDCNETFSRIREMMLHRKIQHPEKVKLCRDNEKCQRKPCGFMHSEISSTNKESREPQEDTPTKQDFQKDPLNLKPPLTPGNKSPNQK